MPPLDPFANSTNYIEHEAPIARNKPKTLTKELVPSHMDIKKSIPTELFAPSLWRSLSYVALDLAVVSLLFATQICLDSLPFIPSYLKTFVLSPVYIFLQGTMFWAIFVLGHDCGHGSFSRHVWINDTVGTFLHTLILVPYTPWKLSHHHHHKNTGNIDKDEVYYPMRKSDLQKQYGSVKTQTVDYFGLGLGWFVYLVVGYGTRASTHLTLNNPLFSKHRVGVITSLTAISLQISLLVHLASIYGAWTITHYYILPLLVFGSWITITTFLHHHSVEDNVSLPWYSNEKWSYVLGNLSSVDRDYGVFHNITHSIGTHQIHHLFPRIPHYNLQQATAEFRKKYPHLVRKSDAPIIQTFKEMFNIYKEQCIISDDASVFEYRSVNKVKESR